MSHINLGHSLFFDLNFLVFLSQDKTRVVCVCVCVFVFSMSVSKKPATLSQLAIAPLLLYLRAPLGQEVSLSGAKAFILE